MFQAVILQDRDDSTEIGEDQYGILLGSKFFDKLADAKRVAKLAEKFGGWGAVLDEAGCLVWKAY